MVSRHLLPTRHDETDRPARDVADEHRQDLACPPVGPVEIFEDEDGGMWRRDGVDQREHALEHLLGRERADRFEVRSRARTMVPGAAQQLDQRRVAQRLIPECDTASGMDHDAGRRAPRSRAR